jgi:hypothetical protein
MKPSFFGKFEVTRLEAFVLTVLAYVAPFLTYFVLLSFAAATIIQGYAKLNHARNVEALAGARRRARVHFPVPSRPCEGTPIRAGNAAL